MPLLAIPLGLLVATIASGILSNRDVGRRIAAFTLTMLADIPVRGAAMALEPMANHSTLWPVGYGLVVLLYAGASAALLVKSGLIVEWCLLQLKAHGTEHEPGLRAGAEAGLFVLAIYFALQPVVILIASRL